ncbi:TPR-like protein [Lichtheimia hyalospora FSU 10163]|nr:TPR-like protein [Lichtheimia hyalospora FSU 10163]
MSLPQLAGGADCGPANPMANLMKQFHQDRSLQQDRFGEQRGESSKAAGFRSRPSGPAPMDHQFTEEFLRDDVRGMERPPGAFEFSGLSRELENIHRQPQEGWASDFMQNQHQMMGPPDAHQFEEFEKIYQQRNGPMQGQHHQWREEFDTFHPPAQHNVLAQHEHEAFERAFDEAKGVDVNWEKEFEAQESGWAAEFAEQEGTTATTSEHDKEALARTAGMLLDSVDVNSNPKFKNSNFMNLMRNLRDRKVSIEGNKMVPSNQGGDWVSEFGHGASTSSWADDFAAKAGNASSGNMWSNEFAAKAERGWSEEFTATNPMHQQPAMASSSSQDWTSEFSKQEADIFGKGTEMHDWVEQYHRGMDRIKEAQDSDWQEMQKDWDRLKEDNGSSAFRATNPEYQTYNFATDNPYLLDPTAIDRVEHNTLADSILALEAKTQLQTSNAGAWQELGFKQQENERDAAAIAALRRAVSMDPTLVEGWLALAVSYTNENCRLDAYDALEQWITNNEKYKHLIGNGKAPVDQHNRHAYITNLFLEAARSSPGAEMDADVQVGLGVLFNVSEEYAKAIDCFKAALQSRPQDYLLWNKLGATLANSRDTTGAIDAYFTALEINPSYVRARYNLAISCINLGQHREAAEHLLTSLAIQQQADSQISMLIDEHGNKVPVQGGMSENVWDSLRMLMFMMNREDLAKHCDSRNLNVFRGEFEF